MIGVLKHKIMKTVRSSSPASAKYQKRVTFFKEKHFFLKVKSRKGDPSQKRSTFVDLQGRFFFQVTKIRKGFTINWTSFVRETRPESQLNRRV